ncbi:MAG: hypothetical protein HOC71_16535 [Candidatus Latescibacteria bacterium]|nr:hypothetical protein [Candidatus Latescibacterota bacterium]
MRIFLTLISILMFCAVVNVSANEAPVRAVGKTIQPRNDVPVRLVSEEVRINISSKEASVRCEFNLLNEGKPDTIMVGFPRGWENDFNYFYAETYGMKFPVTTLPVNPNFSEMNGQEMPWWKIFYVPFDSTGQMITVINNYSIDLNFFGLSEFSDLYFKYIMKTGAYWQGKIDEAVFTVYLRQIPFDQITEISPAGFVYEGDRIIWRFTDFEPTQDIEIFIMNDIRYERLVNAKKILKENSDNVHAHFLLGTAYFVEDVHKVGYEIYGSVKSEKEFLRVLELDPKHLDARWYLAAIYYYRKSKEKSRKLIEEIIAENPNYICTDKVYPRPSEPIIPWGSAKSWLKELDLMMRYKTK